MAPETEVVNGARAPRNSKAAEKPYWAFISYSHADRHWADWLHKALEGYRVPRRLVGTGTSIGEVPPRLLPVFLDRAELAASGDLDATITDALAATRCLIVICSPAAVAAPRVSQEIAAFRGLMAERGRLLSMIVAGRPNADERGGKTGEECFPAALRGAHSSTPLAADVRPGKGGRQEALLKLVAGILDLNLDQLRQRDYQRARRRWLFGAAAGAAAMIAASTLALYAWHQRAAAIVARDAAESARNAAVQAQSRLLTQAAAQRLNNFDTSGAQGIMLEVLTNPELSRHRDPATLNVFQESRAADNQLAVLDNHGLEPLTAFFSPDGTQTVTAWSDKSVSIASAQTGVRIAAFVGHTAIVFWAAYSPAGDRIVTASRDRTARVWDARTGAQLAVMSGHTETVYCAEFSPDGTRVVTASFDKTARIWDARSGRQILLLTGHTGRVNSVAFSRDGKRIVTASTDGSARLWDANTGTSLATFIAGSGSVFAAAISADGSRVVTASYDKLARIWDTHTGLQLGELAGHGDRVYAAAYSPDGTQIATGSLDKTARIWDARTGKQLAVLKGHSRSVSSIGFSPDGTRVITASVDQTVRIWNVRAAASVALLTGHTGSVDSPGYSPDGRRIVTASADKTARIWDARTGGPLAVLSGHAERVYSAQFSPDGARVVTASFDQTARIWDAHDGAQLAVLAGHQDRLIGATYSPDGTEIATASFDHTARIWDARTGSEQRLLSGHRGPVYSVAYSPDGARVVTGSGDGTARVWDARTGNHEFTLTGHRPDFPIQCVTFSPDGTQILTASNDNTARIWDSRTGQQQAALAGHGGAVYWAVFSPDGTRIATASQDQTARIWDAHTGAELLQLIGHRDAVTGVVYSPHRERVFTISNDKTAREWNGQTGEQLAVFAGHQDIVPGLELSPDGLHLVTASEDNTARIWDVDVLGDVESQILWSAAAQADPLSDLDRAQMGIPQDGQIKTWAEQSTPCDQAAAAYYDPERLAPGLALPDVDGGLADSACAQAIVKFGATPRLLYQNGRARLAKHDSGGAKQQLELAVSRGYRVANIDLASQLVDPTNGAPDPSQAIALYEQAWNARVLIAAFELGRLYERGLGPPDTATPDALHPDPVSAWMWYRTGAEAGEPNALARLAERAETNALTEQDSGKKNALLLQAFTYYATAAVRARREDWPDNAWRQWRHRRATLARLLEREGMMQQVADAYREVRHAL